MLHTFAAVRVGENVFRLGIMYALGGLSLLPAILLGNKIRPTKWRLDKMVFKANHLPGENRHAKQMTMSMQSYPTPHLILSRPGAETSRHGCRGTCDMTATPEVRLPALLGSGAVRGARLSPDCWVGRNSSVEIIFIGSWYSP